MNPTYNECQEAVDRMVRLIATEHFATPWLRELVRDRCPALLDDDRIDELESKVAELEAERDEANDATKEAENETKEAESEITTLRKALNRIWKLDPDTHELEDAVRIAEAAL